MYYALFNASLMPHCLAKPLSSHSTLLSLAVFCFPASLSLAVLAGKLKRSFASRLLPVDAARVLQGQTYVPRMPRVRIGTTGRLYNNKGVPQQQGTVIILLLFLDFSSDDVVMRHVEY